ncbi:MAG: peptide chain release factor N(5)-glutamine methyltransferase [Proteobacteria bacterium]|nr:peptide chain release factor N(5)-glutamine methyltransferase [Pseudomonadota bacterium]
MQADSWTIQHVLSWITQDLAGRGVGSPRLDAELLVAEALRCDRIRLYMDLQQPMEPGELAAVRALVKRRRAREPIAYILGRREFYGRCFAVDRSVLIPRPETESVVECALATLKRDSAARVLDIATGSGALAVTLAAERPHLQVDASDSSEAALRVARVNAGRHGVSQRMSFFAGDLFAPLPPDRAYAMIVCNPPYVSSEQWSALQPEIRLYEPREALLAASGGLSFYERIVPAAARWLEPGGRLLLEVGAEQASRVVAMLRRHGAYDEPAVARDVGGRERVVAARAAAAAP